MREEETTGSSDDIAVSPSARGDPLPIYALIGGIVAGVCLMGCVIALVAFFLLRGGDDPRSNRTPATIVRHVRVQFKFEV